MAPGERIPTPATGPVLVLNCGSSSLKFAVVEPSGGDTLLSGLAERVGTPDAHLAVSAPGRRVIEVPLADPSYAGVVGRVLAEVHNRGHQLTGVGHRVVHGGERFTASARIDGEVLAGIEACVPLAPLHNPANLDGIRAAMAAHPEVPHVAVFDTAFHQTMPPRAYRYAVPEDWYAEHRVRRYGFHGTSHRYVAGRAAELLGHPLAELGLVTAHLGNGCSAAAIAGGRSVDTTMGLTPLEGLVMGTRSGDVDPGVFDYLTRETGLDAAEITRRLNRESGLAGLSGRGNDMREVTAAAAAGDERAELALDVFCYRLAKAVSALAVGLGRIDALVFTGGIGEHSAEVRRRTTGLLGVLGLSVDDGRNAGHGRDSGGAISPAGAAPAVLVVPTNEELTIARDTAAIIGGEGN